MAHNVAPSRPSTMAMNFGLVLATDPQPSGGAVPPSGAFAAAIAASAVVGSQLHERPKCIFGRSPAGFAPETAGARRMTEETYSEQPICTYGLDTIMAGLMLPLEQRPVTTKTPLEETIKPVPDNPIPE